MPDGQVYIGESAFSPERLKKADVEVCFKKKPENIDGEKEQLMIRFMHEVYKLIRERVGASLTNENHLVYLTSSLKKYVFYNLLINSILYLCVT